MLHKITQSLRVYPPLDNKTITTMRIQDMKDFRTFNSRMKRCLLNQPSENIKVISETNQSKKDEMKVLILINKVQERKRATSEAELNNQLLISKLYLQIVSKISTKDQTQHLSN
jgi:hypothetical protein